MSEPKPDSPSGLGLDRPERKAVTFAIPPGTPERSCASCGAPMFWLKTKTGRSMPVNPDGTSHFASCPQATQWRNR